MFKALRIRRKIVFVISVISLIGVAATVSGQVPFRVGERLSYDVQWRASMDLFRCAGRPNYARLVTKCEIRARWLRICQKKTAREGGFCARDIYITLAMAWQT